MLLIILALWAFLVAPCLLVILVGMLLRDSREDSMEANWKDEVHLVREYGPPPEVWCEARRWYVAVGSSTSASCPACLVEYGLTVLWEEDV